MAWSELLNASAVEQAQLIRRRSVSSEELTRLYLHRIERLNPSLNAFTLVFAESALRDARSKDARPAKGELAPFYGVPIGIKDLNLVRGTRVGYGSRAVGFWSPIDDRTTARLRRGGFIVLGKLATSELGALPVTEPDTHPPTRNPWDLDRTAGGSSGGSGAAVAAALLPIAHGSDGAGSIRIPASFGHLYGFKPSRGRVANAFGLPDRRLLYTCGPIARTVEDAAAMLDVMAGITVGRPHWLTPPARPFSTVEPQEKPLRVRVSVDSPLVKTHPEVRAAVLRVARLLAELGHHVDEQPPPPASIEEFLPLWQRMVANMPLVRWSRAQPVTRWLADAGRGVTLHAVAQLHLQLEARLLGWWGDIDLWLTPTVAVAPPAVGAWRDLPPAEAFARAAQLGIYTAPGNVVGAPGASLPAGLSTEGWPIGVQLVGRPGDDALVLAMSRRLEAEMPWRGKWSPLLTRQGLAVS